MFPRFVPHTPPPKCKECRGTGRICHPSLLRSWDCPKCNGTGIAGDPRWLVECAIVYGTAVMALAAYLIYIHQ